MGRHILPASLLAGFIAVLPIYVQAQGRAMMAGGAHSMAAPPTMVAHVASPGARAAIPSTRMIARTGSTHPRTTVRNTGRPMGSRRQIFADNHGLKPGCSTVPGLGFDVPHLAAICGPGAVGGGRFGNQIPFFFPFAGGGFYIPSSPVVDEQDDVAEPPQAQDTESEIAETARRPRASRPAQTTVVETPDTAQPQPGEFVFVRRDGTLFFAVAYAWENGTLRYITSEGLRRSLSRDALDLDATQQFNEQRGLNFHLPV
jgi:hypothetical protein